MKKSILILFLISVGLLQSQNPVFQWVKPFKNSPNYGQSIKVDASGNVYTIGFFSNTVDFDPGPAIFNLSSSGNTDIFISKIDPLGNFVWAKRIGGTGTDYGLSLEVDNFGDVYTTGAFSSTVDFNPNTGIFNLIETGGSLDIFILKLDALGNFVWAKSIGDISFDRGMAIALDASNNVYVTGYYQGNNVDFDPGIGTSYLMSNGDDVFILKLNVSGNFVWANSIPGSGSDLPTCIKVDVSGNVIVSGVFSGTANFDPNGSSFSLTSSSPMDLFILKLNSLGNFVWVKRMGGSDFTSSSSLTTDNLDNIYITGQFGGLSDFDPDISNVYNMSGSLSGDGFISKLNSSGNFVWAKKFGSAGEEAGNSIVLDALNNIYVTGAFSTTVDFDPDPTNTLFLTSSGLADIFVLKLDVSGNYLWVGSMGSTGNDVGNAITLDANNNIYSTGYYGGTCDFDPNSATFTITTGGTPPNAYVHKMGQSLSTNNEVILQNKINTSIFPNPNNGLFKIELSSDAQVIITNVLGVEILNEQKSEGSHLIEIQNIANGIYFVKTINSKKNYAIKMIKY